MVASGVKNVSAGDIRMPSGVPINKVRIAAKTTNPSTLRDHVMPSVQAYKTPYYVTSAEGSNFRLGLFSEAGRMFAIPDNSLDWAQNHKRSDYRPLDLRPGFIGYVKPGTMALAYHEGHLEELEAMSSADLRKRLYKVVKFESSGRITLRFHCEARTSTVLEGELAAAGFNKKGESRINYDVPNRLLLLSPGTYTKQVLFEGIHFRMMLDGSIQFIKK